MSLPDISQNVKDIIELAQKTFNLTDGITPEMYVWGACQACLGKSSLSIPDKEIVKMKKELSRLEEEADTISQKLYAFINATKPPLRSLALFNSMVSRSQENAKLNEDELSSASLLKFVVIAYSNELKIMLNQAESLTEGENEEKSKFTIDPADIKLPKSGGNASNGNRADEEEEDFPPKHSNDTPDDEEEPIKPVEEPPVHPKEALKNLTAQTKELQKKLSADIFGQEFAISTFVSGFHSAELANISQPNHKKPRATFLFAGPPGVGKTFLSEKAAEYLGLPFERFDMSEFCDDQTGKQIFSGTPKTFKDSKPGHVTSFVKKYPKSILLFDEIEKAHTSIIYLFLQILDAGRIRDEYLEKEIDFSQTILLFTTNAGKQLYESARGKNLSLLSRDVIMDALEKDINPITNIPFFPPAICSRFATGNVVMFNHIGANNLLKIAGDTISRRIDSIKQNAEIKFNIEDSVYSALLFNEGGNADARTITSRAGQFIDKEIYELFNVINSVKCRTNITDLEAVNIQISKTTSAEIQTLFDDTQSMNVLCFGDSAIAQKCQNAVKHSNIINAQSIVEAENMLDTSEIKYVLIDMSYGTKDDDAEYLNASDINSISRDFLFTLREKHDDIPVYILENEHTDFSEEEEITFTATGIRGIIDMMDDNFGEQIDNVCVCIHQQESIEHLTKTNQCITFETAQTVSSDGKEATIKLIDFRLKTNYKGADDKKVLNNVERPNISFEDVIGAEDAKSELKYFVNFLKNPKRYVNSGLKAPRGVLLYGPPGTGKTMLAKAMASEAGVTFIPTEANRFIQGIIGSGKDELHKIFETARSYAPSVIFIDEFELIGKERKGGDHATANGEDVLTALLTELDGFNVDPKRPVFLLAATNFDITPGTDKSLDGAVLRRFDRKIYVDLPNKEERAKYLKRKISKNKAFQISETEIENLANRSTGKSLAELENVLEFALRNATKNESFVVNDNDLENAFETDQNGDEKKWSIEAITRTARHEAGHALVCWLTGEKPSYLTIVSRGNAGGYMQHGNTEEKFGYNKEEILGLIRTSLAGRAAELVYYGEVAGVSTGPSGDLRNATRLARAYLCDYGMDDDFGLAVLSEREMVEGEVAVLLRKKMNSILKQELQNALEIVRKNTKAIDALVDALMEKTHLDEKQIDEILSATVVR